jgi:hypothetical protein
MWKIVRFETNQLVPPNYGCWVSLRSAQDQLTALLCKHPAGPESGRLIHSSRGQQYDFVIWTVVWAPTEKNEWGEVTP